MSENSNASIIMTYLTHAGYDINYKIQPVHRQLGLDKEYSVSVHLGNSFFEGTHSTGFGGAEERLLSGILREFKRKLDEEKRQSLEKVSDREDNSEPEAAPTQIRVEN